MGGIGISLKEKLNGGGSRRHREVGGHLYHAMFLEFEEPFFRQEIVVALVMHCGQATEEEAELEGALECLENLVEREENIRAMAPFVEFVKTLAHNCHQMRPVHTRLVFSVLSKFVVGSAQDNANWFHIMLKKLLTSSNEAYRAAGAAGAVQYIKANLITEPLQKCKLSPSPNSSQTSGDDNQTNSSAQSLEFADQDEHALWNDSFDLAISACRSSSRAMAVFCEELAAIVSEQVKLKNKHNLGERSLLVWLAAVASMNERIGEDFVARFIYDITNLATTSSSSSSSSSASVALDQKTVECGEMKASFRFNLDDQDTKVAVNLLPNLVMGGSDPRLRERFLFMCSALRCKVKLAAEESRLSHGDQQETKQNKEGRDNVGKGASCSNSDADSDSDSEMEEDHDAKSRTRRQQEQEGSLPCQELLGCPLLLPSDDDINAFFPLDGIANDDDDDENAVELTNARESIMLSIFYSINWIREVINCFSPGISAKAPQLTKKVFARFFHLSELETLLEDIVVRRGGSAFLHALPLVNAKSKDGKRELGRLTSKSNVPLSKRSSSSSSSNNNNNSKAKKSTSRNSGSSAAEKEVLESLRKSYRPFNPNVLEILDQPNLLLKQESSLVSRTLLLYLKDEVSATLNPKRGNAIGGRALQAKKVANAGVSGVGINASGISMVSPNLDEVFRVRMTPAKLLKRLQRLLPAARLVLDAQVEDLVGLRQGIRFGESCGDPDEESGLDVLRAICETLQALLKSNIVRSAGKSLRSARVRAFIAFANGGKKMNQLAVGENVDGNDDQNMDQDDDQDDCIALTREQASKVIFDMLSAWFDRNAVSGTTLQCDIVNLMVDLGLFAKNADLFAQVSSYCHKILMFEERPQALPKAATARLLNLHLSMHESPLVRCEEVIEEITTVMISDDPHCVGECYQALTKSNVAHFFEPVLKILSQLLVEADFEACAQAARGTRKKKVANKSSSKKKHKKEADDDDDDDNDDDEDDDENQHQSEQNGEQDSSSDSDSDGSAESDSSETRAQKTSRADAVEAFKTAKKAASLAEMLILLTRKCSGNKQVLAAAVKQGCVFVETFIKHAVPFLTVYFNRDTTGVQNCLKHVQKSSRQLQAICEFGKASKDAGMMSAVPKLRRLFENLTYSARAIYSANNCIGMFSTGSLKRRGVDGSLIEEDDDDDDDDDKEEADADAGET